MQQGMRIPFVLWMINTRKDTADATSHSKSFYIFRVLLSTVNYLLGGRSEDEMSQNRIYKLSCRE